jgi:hypothetical protein
MDLLGPPVEVRGRADAVWLRLEASAACELHVLEFLNRGELPVDQAGVGQGPEMLGRLELGRVRRQEQQMDMLGDAQPLAGVPACAIQDQHDLLGRTRPNGPREGGELDFKECDADAGGQVEDGAARGRMHKPDEVAPCEAVPHWCHRTLANRRPHAAQQRFQADAMFVGRPQLDACARKGGRDLAEQRP